jgi:hypothetical protein
LSGTVITCVSNEEEFAKEVYEYLYAELEKQKQFEGGKNFLITSELVRLVAGNNEIHVDANALVPKDMIKWILESCLKSNPSRFKDYGVIEFGDTFTIGRILHPSQMEMLTCEICGFFTPYPEELYTHRMTHFGI